MPSDVTTAASLKEFIVDHLNIGVFSVDKDMNVLLWNGFMENNSHRSANEVLGKNLFELFPELPQKWLSRKFKSVFILKNFAFSSWEQRPYLFKFSHNRPITGGVDCMRQDLMLMPVKGATGEVEAVSVALLDMTDVSIFQSMMAQTMEQMETLDDIVKTINRETNLENLLTTVLHQGLMLFPQADVATFFLLDHQDNRFKVAAETASGPFSVSNGDYLIECAQKNKELAFSYDQMMARYTKDSEQLEGGLYILRHFDDPADHCLSHPACIPQCYLSMAVTIEEQLNGFLVFSNFRNKEAFADSDIQKLARFREHAVSAISKAKFLKAIAEEGDKVKNLLDNAGQGFLSFASDLKIEGEHSAECHELFGAEIEGRLFPELLFADDPSQRDFLISILQDIFADEFGSSSTLFFSLLPQEVVIGQNYISIEYKPIKAGDGGDHKIMVILTDITEKRSLEDQMEEERNRLRMVVSAVTRRNEIIKSIREYQAFSQQGMFDILNSDLSLEDKVFEIFRVVHTFKGGFSQLDLVHVIKQIHLFESQLAQLRERSDSLELDEFKQLCHDTPMWSWMEPDLAILTEALGADFLGQEQMLTVEASAISAIGQQMLQTLSPIENQVFQPQLRRLKAKSFKDLLRDYSDYIERLAEDLDKAVAELDISGDEVLVNPDEFDDFIHSLVHVFRNIMDHGIEAIEDRMELGKEELGTVRCRVSHQKNQIMLTISDDGHGIDIQSLRKKAVDIGLYQPDEADALDDEQLIELIFAEQVSSKDSVNELSGRGIGLSAVKQALEKLGGSVKVTTELGVGTEFHFNLPFNEAVELPAVDVEMVVKTVVNQTITFLTDEAGVDCQSTPPAPQQSESLPLNGLTTLTRIKGLLDGVFLLSFDEQLTRTVVRQLLLDSSGEESEFLAEVMAESCNMILGNAINDFTGISELVMMDIPLSLNTRPSMLDNLSVEVWTSLVETAQGPVSISFLSSS